jgi:SAM-dependent methyltransferase
MALELGRSSAEIASQIVERLEDPDGYVAFHGPRYAKLLYLIDKYLEPVQHRMLDIGPTAFTRLLHDQFGVAVDSLGFAEDAETGLGAGNHYQFDLNDAQWPKSWRRDLPAYDVVIMAEVIEHLHTSPALVLAFVRACIRPGGVLIVQTPNAVRLGARLNLLGGRHPFPLIREDVTEPGHFREYTRQELAHYASACGFEVDECIYSSYFDLRYSNRGESRHSSPALLTAINFAYRLLPDKLKMGMTVVLRRPLRDGGQERSDGSL